MSGTVASLQTNFTAGELNKNLYGRGDLNIYENGARKLENVIIRPTGGVSRRRGLKKITEFSEKARLIPFEFNTEQTYLICLTNKKCHIYKNDVKIAELETPWSTEQLFDINYTQSADTLLLMHKDVEPQKIMRGNNEVWEISPWEFYSEKGIYYCPYYNFYDGKVSLQYENVNGLLMLIANSGIFSEDWIGIRIRLGNGCLKIFQYASPTTVYVTAECGAAVGTYTDWEECAFSNIRGWPICATFHQDRLVIGGSKSLPNHLWMSKSSDLFNFDYGKGLDDDAIDFELLSDQVNAIRAVVSSRNLLIFTSGAEWVVKGDTITPDSLQIVRQTTIGTYGKSAVAPTQIDGAIMFISPDGRQLRQFLYTDLEDAYQSLDVTLLSENILHDPRDVAFSQSENVLYIVLDDGSISALTIYRSEEVKAWSHLKTEGKFESVTSLENKLYFCVMRNNKYYLECFDSAAYSDCFQKMSSDEPTEVWSGFDNFEGCRMSVVADGHYVGKFEVSDGKITLFAKVSTIIAGLAYDHIIEPLPYVSEENPSYSPKAIRVVDAMFRIIDSQGLCIDLGEGYHEVSLEKICSKNKLDMKPKLFSGDVEMKALGWIRDINKPMWSIKSDTPFCFTLLSVLLKVKVK